MASFCFLDLSRELRNMIYEQTIQPRRYLQYTCSSGEISTYVLDAPRMNILLANRQLKYEYQEQLSNRTRLLVVLPYLDGWTNYVDLKESIVKSTKHCVVYIHVGCMCDHEEAIYGICLAGEILMTSPLSIRHRLIARMPHLQTMQLRIGAAQHFKQGQDEEKTLRIGSQDPPILSHSGLCHAYLKAMAELPQMDSIVIERCANKLDYEQFCEGERYPILATWTRKDGWLAQLK